MQYKLLLSAMVVTAILAPTACSLAADIENIPVEAVAESRKMAEISMVEDSYYYPGPDSSQASYEFDEQATRQSADTTSALIQLKCNPKAALSSLGFNPSQGDAISMGISLDGYDYTMDFRSCSMYANKTNYSWTSQLDALSESEAMMMAKKFITSSFLQSKIYNKLADPVVLSKSNDMYPMPYYDIKGMGNAESVYTQVNDFADIEIIEDEETEVIEREFTRYTIVFPYKLGTKAIYNNYGQAAGITVEVTSEGVLSTHVQLLPFLASLKTSEKMSAEERIDFVKQGWNNPYRGETQKIKLTWPERVYVFFNLWRNNQTQLFISSGIKFSSDIKIDNYSQLPYQMVVSDYKIGNNYMY